MEQQQKKKHQKKCFVLKIIAFELGTTNSHDRDHDPFVWQSV